MSTKAFRSPDSSTTTTQPIPHVASTAVAPLTPASISYPPALLSMVCLAMRLSGVASTKSSYNLLQPQHDASVSHQLARASEEHRHTRPRCKRRLGPPALRITSDYHPDDLATIKWIQSKQIE